MLMVLGLKSGLSRAALWVSAVLTLMVFVGPVHAQGQLQPLTGGALVDAEQIRPGDQALGTSLQGQFSYAGRDLFFDGASAIFGMSSDIAYVMMLDGTARLADQKAKRGRIILIPPYGQDVAVKRFDAERFLRSFSPGVLEESSPYAHARLQAIADRQAIGAWWGYTKKTNLNVNAPGGAEAERVKRALTSNDTMQQVRFAEASSDQGLGQRVVEAFLNALKRKDEKAVAALLDPQQFGGLDMRGGGDSARLATARLLIKSFKPTATTAQPFGASPEAEGEPGAWSVDTQTGQRTVRLRKTGDLIFIAAVS